MSNDHRDIVQCRVLNWIVFQSVWDAYNLLVVMITVTLFCADQVVFNWIVFQSVQDVSQGEDKLSGGHALCSSPDTHRSCELEY